MNPCAYIYVVCNPHPLQERLHLTHTRIQYRHALIGCGLRVLAGLMLVPWLTGCLGGSSDPLGHRHDFGDNDANVVLCMGDSITAGGFSGGAPWPTLFGQMVGKQTINDARRGVVSADGANRIIASFRRHKPGFVIIAYGANDAIRGTNPAATGVHIRQMIHVAKSNRCIPVVATVMPMTGPRSVYNDRVDLINREIRAAARDENVKLADIHRSVRSDPDSLYVDGLHLNRLGEVWVAMTFMDAFK